MIRNSSKFKNIAKTTQTLQSPQVSTLLTNERQARSRWQETRFPPDKHTLTYLTTENRIAQVKN